MLRSALVLAQQARTKSAFERKEVISRRLWSKRESSGFLLCQKKNVLIKATSLSWTFKKDLATVKFPAFTKSPQQPSSDKSIDAVSTVPVKYANPLEWVDRSSFDKAVITNFRKNWNTYKNQHSLRQNDYSGLLITGGIGIGKTRAANQIPYIIADYLNTTEDSTARDHFAAVVYISLDYRQIRGMPIFKEYSIKAARPKEGPNDSLIVGLFLYAFSSVLRQENTPAGSTTIDLSKEGIDIDRLFSDIYATTKAKADKPILLYLHVDEYQMDPYYCLALTRFVSSYNIREHKRGLIVLVFSGLGPSDIVDSVSGSNYLMQIVRLKLSVKSHWLMSLADHFIKNLRTFGKNDAKAQSTLLEFKKKHNDIYYKLLATTGGIPKFVEELVLALASAQHHSGPTAAARSAFNQATNALQDLYSVGSGRANSAWFNDSQHIKIFLQKAFFKKPVSRLDKLNGKTVGELEKSGVIYLTDAGGGENHLIGLPLMMLRHLEKVGQLRLFEGLKLITDPFATLNEDAFEEFIAEVYTFSWRLLSGSKNITLSEFHRNLLLGKKALLNQIIDLPNENINVVHARATPRKMPKHSFALVGIESPMRFDDPACAFVLRTRKRASAPDIVLPGRLQVQLKWSLRSADLEPVVKNNNIDEAAILSSELITKEAAKGLPKLPFVLISPKIPEADALFAITTPGPAKEFQKVGLITGANCFKFMEPFYMLDVEDKTIVVEAPELEAPKEESEVAPKEESEVAPEAPKAARD